MAKPKLALIPAAQGTKFYSVLPSDGVGDFQFSRLSSGTRIAPTGLIETVPIATSRLNYDLLNGKVVNCPHYLLEPARTNSIIQSENLGTSWSTFNGGSISTNESTSPDGSLTADKLSTNGTSFSFVRPSTNPTISTGNTTFTVFAKADTSDELWLRLDYGTTIYNRKFNLTTQTISTGFDNTGNIPNEETIEDYGNGWYRLIITDSADTTTFNPRIYVSDATSTSGDSVFLWGAQLEEGSYPTSYIPTTGTAISRIAETADFSGNAQTFNDSEGVFMAEISALANDGTDRVITISDGTNSNRVTLFYETTANTLGYNIVVGGSSQANNIQTLIDVTSFTKVCIKYKTNDFALWINGFELSTDTSGSTFSEGTLTRINFDDGGGGVDFYGNTRELQYFDSVLTDAQLETLTSWTSLQEMITSQLYTNY